MILTCIEGLQLQRELGVDVTVSEGYGLYYSDWIPQTVLHRKWVRANSTTNKKTPYKQIQTSTWFHLPWVQINQIYQCIGLVASWRGILRGQYLCFSRTDWSVFSVQTPSGKIHSRLSLIHAYWWCPLIGHFEDHWPDAHYINRTLTEPQKPLRNQLMKFSKDLGCWKHCSFRQNDCCYNHWYPPFPQGCYCRIYPGSTVIVKVIALELLPWTNHGDWQTRMALSISGTHRELSKSVVVLIKKVKTRNSIRQRYRHG